MYIFTNCRKITCFFEDLSVSKKKKDHSPLFFSICCFFFSSFNSFLTTNSCLKHRRIL